MNTLPSNVRIWEVGPRHGLQNEQQVIDTEHKVAFIDRLRAAGLPVIEATSFVRADRIPQLADGAEVMSRITRRAGVRYPVLVPNDRGLTAAVAADARDIAVFASATNTFAERNLGRTLVDTRLEADGVTNAPTSRSTMWRHLYRAVIQPNRSTRVSVSATGIEPWLKAPLRPMLGMKVDRTASVAIQGYASTSSRSRSELPH